MKIINVMRLRDINIVRVEVNGCEKEFKVDKSCESESEIIEYIKEWYSNYL